MKKDMPIEFSQDRDFKSGSVALIGRPNVGKSTLMNRILGEKLAIITDTPQTTRNRILGIKTTRNAQILFLDTPGIHEPRHRLNEVMLKTSLSALRDADLVLFLIEPRIPPGREEQFALNELREIKRPIFLIINKIDKSSKQKLLPCIEEYRHQMSFAEILPVSALTGDGVAGLEEMICSYLPKGPPYFPEDSLTDLSERFLIAEMIREKIILLTHDEIPHAVAVVVEGVKKRTGKNLIDVDAVVYVEKDSQKGILVGRKGTRMKEIGTAVRPEIEEFLNARVFLRLWVKVRKDWRSQIKMLRELGFK
jgi:GTP-binding protein Era